MASAEDAGEHHESHLDVHPLLEYFTLRAYDLHKHERKERAGDDLPGAFHPEMDHPPPPELILYHALGVDHARQVHEGQEHEAAQERSLDAGPLPGLAHGHEVVEKEQEHGHHDEDVRPARGLDVLAAFVQDERSEHELVRLRIDAHPDVAQNDGGDRDDRGPELEQGQGDAP